MSIGAMAQGESPDTIASHQLNEVVVNGEKPQVKGELCTPLCANALSKPLRRTTVRDSRYELKR